MKKYLLAILLLVGSTTANAQFGDLLNNMGQKLIETAVDKMVPGSENSVSSTSEEKVKTSKVEIPEGSPKTAEEYCERVTKNPEMIKLFVVIRDMDKRGYGNNVSNATTLDNDDRDLEKWVAGKLLKVDMPVRIVFGKWAGECVATSKELSLLSSRNVPANFRNQELEQGKFWSNKASPNLATLLAFAFPGAEEIIKHTSVETLGRDERKAAERKKMADEEDFIKYGGLRNYYKFRTNPAVASAFGKCLSGEQSIANKEFQDEEITAKSARSVNDQNKILAAVAEGRKNIKFRSFGRCIARLGIGLNGQPFDTESTQFLASSLLALMSFGTEPLDKSFTAIGLKGGADMLNIPADQFWGKFEKIMRDDKIDMQIRMGVGTLMVAVQQIIDALIEGKLQQ
jgi:hypothetical protein